MIRHLMPLLLLLVAACPAWAGRLEQMQFYAPVLKRVWAYSVYRPDAYHDDGRVFPVLYFLHGSSRIAGDWRQLNLAAAIDAEIAAGRLPPLVIVVPEMGASWGMDGAEPMETAFFHDLMPEVERTQRIRNDGRGRVIGGISAGGFASLRYALRNPGMFAAVALLSPAIYDPLPPETSGARHNPAFGMPEFDPVRWAAANYPAQLDGFFAQKRMMPLYVGSGDQDRLGIQEHAVRLHRLWRAHGQRSRFRLVPGDHTYPVWRALLPQAVDWAMQAVGPPDCTVTLVRRPGPSRPAACD